MAETTNIRIILGDDDGRVAEESRQYLEAIAPRLDPEFGRELISGHADNVEEARNVIAQTLQSLQTLPFFGEKLVHLKSTNLFSNNQTATSESSITAVSNLLDEMEAGLPDNIHLLITGGKLDKVRRNGKRIKKFKNFTECNKVEIKKGWERNLKPYIEERARKVGASFSPNALELFTILVGAETSLIDNEIEKLSLYSDDKLIQIDTVRAMVPLSEAGFIFEIGEALSRANGGRALALIDRQLEVGGKNRDGESPVALMRASIIPTIRRLLHAKILIERHGVRPGSPSSFANAVQALPSSATAFLPRKKDGKVNAYSVGMIAEQANNFKLSGLVAALEECLEADRSLVTTQLDGRMVLHRLVGRVLAAAKPKRHRRRA